MPFESIELPKPTKGSRTGADVTLRIHRHTKGSGRYAQIAIRITGSSREKMGIDTAAAEQYLRPFIDRKARQLLLVVDDDDPRHGSSRKIKPTRKVPAGEQPPSHIVHWPLVGALTEVIDASAPATALTVVEVERNRIVLQLPPPIAAAPAQPKSGKVA